MTLLLHIDWLSTAAFPLIALLAIFCGGFVAARAAQAMKGQKRTGTSNRTQRRAEQARSRRRG